MAASQLAGTLVEQAPASGWAWTEPEIHAALATGPAGLGSVEARVRLRRAGLVAPHHRRTELVLLLRQFANPITAILIFATLVSALLGEASDAVVILAIVLLSGVLSFWQEYAASRAVEDLLGQVQVTVEVIRDGVHAFVPSYQVVPGDLAVVDTGDLIPGDALLLDAEDLLIDEAPLTGESYPVEKQPARAAEEQRRPSRLNQLFMGTHVVRGRGTAVMVRTGADTVFGRIARELERRPPVTRFERGLTSFGALLLRVMLVLVVGIFVVNLALQRPLADSFLFSVALAVGLTPQLLPAIVSISLSLGARRMARSRVIVKRLNAIEDFGSMAVLCTDKTGTLTRGVVRLGAALDPCGNPSRGVLEAAALNAFLHTGFANPIDDAVLTAAHVQTLGARRCGEVPYDFQRQRMSVAVERREGVVLLTKGAVERVLAVCTSVQQPDGALAPLEEVVAGVRQRFAALSGQGYRVLGVASKPMLATELITPEAEAGMTFLGFLTFFDPPKRGIKRTLRELAALGIQLRIVTGDNRLAATHVARAVGLDARHVLTGDDLGDLDDQALVERAASVQVFAEVDPVQKERIIRVLKRAGFSVGYLGDGINDAPALHAADVGISVDTAVDVARDAASIVLLAKDLDVLMDGVRLGRQTFANTLKYVFVTTSANFGNMASLAAATLFLPFLPLLPLQVLLLNFLSDLPATTIAGDAVDPEQVQRPGAWDMHMIRDFMLVFGLVSSAFDMLTFAVLRLGFRADEGLFRSGWFIESVATELAVMLVLRTRRPFFRSRPGSALLWSSIVVALITLALPLSPLGHPLGLEDPPLPVLVSLGLITAGYVFATELAKARFHRADRGGVRVVRARVPLGTA